MTPVAPLSWAVAAGKPLASTQAATPMHLGDKRNGGRLSARRAIHAISTDDRAKVLALNLLNDYINVVAAKNQTDNGKVRGRGRPAIQAGEETVPVTVRMTLPQRDKLARLGGPKWLRDRVDKAREPD